MDILFLNFPTFYHSAIKSNTSLPQFNAVSVLLLGDVRENALRIVSMTPPFPVM